jgi:hypothetical protein
MYKEAGEPLDGETKQPVDPAYQQDDFIYKILAMLDQERMEDTFGVDSVSELQEELGFSRLFMDNMRAMVAEHYGHEAAERFMAQNKYQEKNAIHPSPKDVLEPEKAMSQASATEDSTDTAIRADRPHRKRVFNLFSLLPAWTRGVAAAILVLAIIFGGYNVSVQAVRLPTVNSQAQNKGDYSEIGALEDLVINRLDMANYPKTLEKIYIPAVAADGYEEVDREQTSKMMVMYYGNENGDTYEYRQNTMDTSAFLDTELSEGYEVTVNDYLGYLVVRKGKNNLWWTDYDYIYQLIGNFSEVELVNIAESLYRMDE